MLNSTEQTKTSLTRDIDKQIAFIDLELSWVSSDAVADSLELQKRALVADRFRLKIPVSR